MITRKLSKSRRDCENQQELIFKITNANAFQQSMKNRQLIK